MVGKTIDVQKMCFVGGERSSLPKQHLSDG